MTSKKVYVGYMKSVPGENDLSMFINEAPEGGFEWKFLDYKPEDMENYTPVYISLSHPHTGKDIEAIEAERDIYHKQLMADEKKLVTLREELEKEQKLRKQLEALNQKLMNRL